MSPSPPSSSSWSPEKVCAAAVVSLSLAHLALLVWFAVAPLDASSAPGSLQADDWMRDAWEFVKNKLRQVLAGGGGIGGDTEFVTAPEGVPVPQEEEEGEFDIEL